MRFQDRIALVTGGSSGIGAALVRALAAGGARVLTCGRNQAALAAQRAQGIETLACDLATAAGRDALVHWAKERSERLDLLFHNAGIQRETRIGAALDAGQVEEEIAVNLLAPILVTAGLVERLAAGRDPCVVHLSSGLAIAPKASAPVYCATKAALSNFSRGLRFQLEPRGVRVVDVVTPLVRTPMTEGRNEGALEPDAFAAALLARIAAGHDEVYIGRARLLPLLLRIAPERTRNLLRHG